MIYTSCIYKNLDSLIVFGSQSSLQKCIDLYLIRLAINSVRATCLFLFYQKTIIVGVKVDKEMI